MRSDGVGVKSFREDRGRRAVRGTKVNIITRDVRVIANDNHFNYSLVEQ